MNPNRRTKLPQNPACESLEGRQLLTAGANMGMVPGLPPTGMNGAADVSMTGLSQVPSVFWGDQGNLGGQSGTQGATQSVPGMPGADALGGPGGQGNQLGSGMGLMGISGVGGQAFGGQGGFGGQSVQQGPGQAIPGMQAMPGADALGGLGGQGNQLGSGMGLMGISGVGGQAFGGQGGFGGQFVQQGPGQAIPGMPGADASGGQFGPGSNVGGMSNGFGGGSSGFGHDIPISFGQGNPAGTGSTATPTPLQTDMEKLRTDLQAIHDKSQVTPALEAAVRDSLKAVQAAATGTADATALATLQTDIKTAQANPGGPTADQIAQIQADQDAVFKSQGVSDELLAQLTDSLKAVQLAAGVTDADRATIAADQEAIKADLAARATSVTSTDPASGVRPMMAGPMTLGTRSDFAGFSPNSAPPAAATDAAVTTTDAAVTTTDAAVTSVAAATNVAATPTDPPATPVAPPAIADPMFAYSAVSPRTIAKGPGRSLPIGAVAKGGTGAAAVARAGGARSNATGSGIVTRAQGAKGLGAMSRAVGQQIMSFGRSIRRPRG
ncbi:hypothetical protein P12x_005459 [Tundrisphaera lichenicola]|uniref:hypothetical protein n=1 Tax=Tundrisphaera lichenicola TaxID=2029860 RepID=UPI003EBCAE13